MHYSLGCPPESILRLYWVALLRLSCISVLFFVSLFFLLAIFNPHVLILECRNLSRLDLPDVAPMWDHDNSQGCF